MKQSSNIAVVGPAEARVFFGWEPREEPASEANMDPANTYWLNYRAGTALHARGIQPVQQAQHLARIAGDAPDPALRCLARQAVVRFGCGEMIGERRSLKVHFSSVAK